MLLFRRYALYGVMLVDSAQETSLRNFRGVARQSDAVRSIRGLSGVQNSRVAHTAAVCFAAGVFGKILTHPLEAIQGGDSGAALIRVSDNAVLGTLKGILVYSGRAYGMYTSAQLY